MVTPAPAHTGHVHTPAPVHTGHVHTPPAPPCRAPGGRPWETAAVANGYPKAFGAVPAPEFGETVLFWPHATVCSSPAVLTQALQEPKVISPETGPHKEPRSAAGSAGGLEGKPARLPLRPVAYGWLPRFKMVEENRKGTL